MSNVDYGNPFVEKIMREYCLDEKYFDFFRRLYPCLDEGQDIRYVFEELVGWFVTIK